MEGRCLGLMVAVGCAHTQVMRPRYRDSHQKFYLEHSDEVLAIATHPFKYVRT